jgi:hypothetical protein
MNMRVNLQLTAGLALLLSVASTRADLTFVLTPAVQSGVRSNAVVFTGTLSNTSSNEDLFLNDIQVSFTGTATNYLTANTNAFFANVPGILSPGETYSDIVFAVAISATAPAGDYFGSVTIQGGSNIFAAADLASQTFQISSFDTAFDAWRMEQFGINANEAGISGDFADPDGDSLVNLLEYALHLDPNVAGASGLPAPGSDSTCDCLTLTYTKVTAATDLTYAAEAADEPGGSWSTNGVTEVIITGDGVTQTIRANDAANPFAIAGKRFMHLRITRLQP